MSYGPLKRHASDLRRSDGNGGCHCGTIRFSATGEPDFPHLCSCEHCQRLLGAR
ncbi:GFA family protein [Nocardia nova]|uniref:GFA family protein n=1 Tax=Nocardia nova TaxID=37330 RepID=UPI003F75D4B4